MITTLRDGKARLSELVERASRGEDVLITVRGKVKARLTRVAAPDSSADKAAWMRELRAIRKKYTIGSRVSTDEILSEIREDRF